MHISHDDEKARILLHYLSNARFKLHERDMAREQVKIAIKRLKGMSKNDIAHNVNELERQIAQALEKEKQILVVSRNKDGEHATLIQTIDALQAKLDKYVHATKERQNRVHELERKMLKASRPREYELLTLKEGLVELERKYREETQSDENDPVELKKIGQQIKALRARVAMLE